MKHAQAPVHYEYFSKHAVFHSIFSELKNSPSTFYELLRTAATAGCLAEVLPGLQIVRAALEFDKAGKQVFVINRDLQTALATTEIDRVPLEYLRLPYRTVYFALENCEYYTSSESGREQLRGVYVTEVSAERYEKKLEQEQAALYQTAMKSDSEKPYRTMLAFTSWSCSSPARSLDSEDITWFTLFMSEENTFIENDVEFVDLKKEFMRKFSRATVAKENIENCEFLAKVVINLLLYLNSSAAKVTKYAPEREILQKELKRTNKKGKKLEELKRRASAASDLAVTVVAPEFKLQNKKESVQQKTGDSRTVRPHMRRGHFRITWIGSRTEDGNRVKGKSTKLNWIEPVLVNAGAGEMIYRKFYTVGENKNGGVAAS